MTTEQEKIALAETVINAFGSVHFNPDTVANKGVLLGDLRKMLKAN